MVGPTGFANLSGITFPATQVPSADANTLDDYEEGTWTPALRGGSTAGTWTFSTNQGGYTKIGNVVTVWLNIQVSSVSGSPNGSAIISGLPFTAAFSGVVNSQHTIVADNLGSDSRQMTGQIEQGAGYITLLSGWGSTGGHSGLSATLFSGNESVRGTAVYRVD